MGTDTRGNGIWADVTGKGNTLGLMDTCTREAMWMRGDKDSGNTLGRMARY